MAIQDFLHTSPLLTPPPPRLATFIHRKVCYLYSFLIHRRIFLLLMFGWFVFVWFVFFFNFFFSPVFCYSLTLGSLFHSASVSFLPGVCPFPYQLSILPLLLSFQSLLPKVWGLGGISASMNLCKISSIAKIIVVLCLH